jgi:hypothetical protein
MPDTIPCPQSGAPAQITEQFWLDSTDGPIEHLKTACLSKQWLTPLAEMVRQSRSPPRIAAWRCCRADRTRRCRRSSRAPGAW